jgi:hypothetical protein
VQRRPRRIQPIPAMAPPVGLLHVSVAGLPSPFWEPVPAMAPPAGLLPPRVDRRLSSSTHASSQPPGCCEAT